MTNTITGRTTKAFKPNIGVCNGARVNSQQGLSRYGIVPFFCGR